MNKIRLIKNKIALMMLVLFANTLASTSLFYHVHIVDGIILAHSHYFYSDDPTDVGHTHTEAEFVSIAKITSLEEIILSSIATIVLLVSLLMVIRAVVQRSHISIILERPTLRGPPRYLYI